MLAIGSNFLRFPPESEFDVSARDDSVSSGEVVIASPGAKDAAASLLCFL